MMIGDKETSESVVRAPPNIGFFEFINSELQYSTE